jgi:hypothetical protein
MAAQSVILCLSGVCDAPRRFDGLLLRAVHAAKLIPLALVLQERPEFHLYLSRNVDAELQRDSFQLGCKWDDRVTIALDMEAVGSTVHLTSRFYLLSKGPSVLLQPAKHPA